MNIDHPKADPSLISFHRPELRQILDELTLTLDCWSLLNTNGRGTEKSKYLPQDPGEYRDEYDLRLNRATYTPIFRDAIRGYAGLLGRFQLIDPPRTLLEAEFDVDRQGSSIYTFGNHCDELALRDGGVYIVVDMLPSSGANNYRDQAGDGRRPYLIRVQRRDLINWSTSFKDGREIVDFVVVRQVKATPPSRGNFGVELEPVYYLMRPGETTEYRLEFKDGRWRNKKGATVKTTAKEVPISWYGSSASKFGQGGVPMSGLAELSIQHYQMRSDLVELLHKCAMPVPVRKGAPVGPDGRVKRLMLGSNTGVDIPETGDFKFEEPTGTSLERHQAEISHLEDLMDRSSLNFLYGTNSRTATEASLRSSQVSSQVSGLVRNKAAAFRHVMFLWAHYSGEEASLRRESGIAINDALINRPIDPSGMAQLLNLHKSKVLSRRTVLDELVRGGVLDPDLSIDDELRRVEEEAGEEEAPQGDDGPQPTEPVDADTLSQENPGDPA
jgi:hypothetical protein